MEEENNKLNDDEIQRIVNEIREWMEKELPNARRDDTKILNFLAGCKYRIDTAKSKLKNDYHFRKSTPEWYANRDPEEEDVRNTLALGLVISLDNYRDKEGRCIFFSRPNFHDISLSGDILYKAVNMSCDEAMESDPSVSKDGIVLVIDLDKTTFTHCVKKTMVLRKVIYWWLSCLPLRIKAMHFVNFPSFATYFINIVKRFWKEKMRKRFIIHKNTEDLKQYIDGNFLPEEYGGTAGPFEKLLDNYMEKILEKRQYFINEEY